MKNLLLRSCLILSFYLAGIGSSALSQDDAQLAADKRKVSVLMRLTNINVNEKPKLKTVVIRFLKTVKDESEFLTYAKRFQIAEANDRLWQMANESEASENRVQSLELLMSQWSVESLREKILSAKEPEKLIEALGLVSSKSAIQALEPLVVAKNLNAAGKNAAVKGIGKQVVGQKYLLQLVNDNQLPKECEFTVANLLLSSANEEIRKNAAKKMKLPATAGSKPLPPISQLVKRNGNLKNGQSVFAKKGTCANCHKVLGQGKEVGPDLTEIGSKLSKQAMYESILNPSMAVSHNYETYLIETLDGLSLSGILISETEDAVVIRTAEAITKEIRKEDIEGMKKSKQSLMPSDLQKNFSEEDLVDMVEYLMTLKKK